MTTHDIYIIVAIDNKNGIGKNKKMPWSLGKEISYFKKVTTNTSSPEKENIVIMGRTTWESIKPKYRPLEDRKNIVLTRNKGYQAEGASLYHSLEKAIDSADENIDKIFIIGGESVFKEAINKLDLKGLYITEIHKNFDCDTFFPEIPEIFTNKEKLGTDEEDGIKFNYYLYKKS